MRALVTTLAAVALCAAVAPSATAQEGIYDFIPNEFFAKAHQPTTHAQGFGPWISPTPTRTATRNAPDVFQSGAHPDASTGFRMIDGPSGRPRGTRTILVDAPPGFVGSTTAVPTCPMSDFMTDTMYTGCSNRSQVGISGARIAGVDPADPPLEGVSPIFKIPPPTDAPARFGYRTNGGQNVFIVPRLRSDGDYGLRVEAAGLPSHFGILESVSTLWGVPYDSIHDVHRIEGNGNPNTGASIPADVERKAFLTNPTYCDSGPLPRTIYGQPWYDPDVWMSDTVYGAQAPDNCDKLEFGTLKAPVSMTLSPDGTSAGGPTGLDVRLRLPFNHDPYGLARPALRSTLVEFPEGLVVNPSAANGLEACTEEQIGLKSLALPSCPDASRLASVKVTTPLLAEPLDGQFYLAEQNRNPFNSTMAVYLAVAGQGVQAKVAGRVDRDPATGRITTSFVDNPQLPFTELDLRLKAGTRASLVLPEVCGRYETKSTLTPWSHPHTGPPLERVDPFDVGAAKGCVSSLASRPFGPAFRAGTESPVGGSFSQFNARFTRADANKEYDRITVRTPKGLAGKLKGIPYCSEAGIAQAISRDKDGDGAVEKADPSCNEASRVGTTRVSAGAGAEPFYVSGDAYLAGPYKGAPLSLVFIVPAVAGPFDLGVQVVRAAINVDRRSAQITTVSDEIPKILRGVPLRIRDIQVLVDRKDFTVNPTDCSEQQVAADLFATQNGHSQPNSRFQVGGCAGLPFKPRLSLKLVGRNQRTTGKHPGINATVKQTGVGEAGIKKAVVKLPKSLALDVNNAQALCEYVDGTKPDLENHCPAGSIIGRARAKTPLLDDDLAGNVYFVKNIRRDPKTGNEIRTLPMLVVALRGQVAINLVGESDTQNGRLVNTFNGVPDAPVSQFNMNIKGGKNGIIAVTRTRRANINLCTRPKSHIADADMDGQNGKRYDRNVRMKTPCTKRQIKKAKRAAKRASAAKARAGSKRG